MKLDGCCSHLYLLGHSLLVNDYADRDLVAEEVLLVRSLVLLLRDKVAGSTCGHREERRERRVLAQMGVEVDVVLENGLVQFTNIRTAL